MLKRHAAFFTFVLGAFDSLFALGAFALAVYFSSYPENAPTYMDAFRDRLPYFVLFVLVWCGAATDRRLFESHRGESLTEQVAAVVRAAIFSLILSTLIMAFLRQSFEQDFLLVFGVSTLVTITLFRLSLRLFLWFIRRRGLNFRQVLIVGANERASHFADVIREHGQYGFVVRGVLDDDESRMRHFREQGVEYIGPLNKLESLLKNEVIDEVYLTLPVRSHYEEIQNVANLCEGIGVPVRLLADFFPLRIARSRVHLMEDIPFISMTTVPEQTTQLIAKRFIDIVASSAGLLVLLPTLFLPLAILIKLESRGPVFFAQERVGLNRRRFQMLKFRSMVANAEELQETLREQNEADGPVFKMRKDPRVTRVGAFIRKYSLDEFPQLINVWLGHMSLVGPRPPIPSEVVDYSWEQRRRLSVRPGMTGLWQVSGRSDIGFDEWVRLDLQYIDTWSLLLDFNILWRTFGAVVRGRGAA